MTEEEEFLEENMYLFEELEEEINLLREMLLVLAGVHIAELDHENHRIVATKVFPPSSTVH